MLRYLLSSAASHFRAGRSLFLLTVLGVALGVASVLSIQIINRNAVAAFEGSMQAVSGDADLTVLGRNPTLPESIYPRLLAHEGVAAAWPLYRVTVAVAGYEQLFLDVIGLDFFAPVQVPFQGGDADLEGALGEPGWAAFTPVLAKQMGWSVGDSVRVFSGSDAVWLRVGALVDFQQISPVASPKMVVMDIAQAQHLLGRRGQVQQFDVVVRDDWPVERVRDELEWQLGAGVQVVTPEQRRRQTEGLLAAFRLNLTALSLISLFVGLFLVYSSTQASLVRRRSEFGLLRSLGATRGQVFGLIAIEVAILGSLGVMLGVPLGYWGAETNIAVVSTALTNLYQLDEISAMELPASLFGLAALIGVGGALAGAAIPALDMSRRDPRSLLAAFTLHERISSLANRLALGGAALLAATGAWYFTTGHTWQHAGFVLGFSLLVTLPLLTPVVVRTATGWVRVRSFGPGFGLRNLGARLQITAFAVAALGVAVSMLVGITMLVGSFRDTLEVWIANTVQADIYVSPASWRGRGDEAFLDVELVAALARHPGVRALDRLRGFVGHTQGDDRITLAGIDMGLPGGETRFELLQGDVSAAYEAVHRGGGVLVGETLARKQNLWTGDQVVVYTAAGPTSFPIAGVYYDYNAQGGAVFMDLSTMDRHWGPSDINSVAVYLEPGIDADGVIDQLRAELPLAALEMRSNRRLRQEAMEIFDQTFAITRLLQLIGLLIAVCGITLMLLVLGREQLPELALYRSIGATRRQIFGLFVGKGLGMGLMGLTMGAVGGTALAMVLIFVINRAYFGWTIQVHWPWVALAEQGLTILAATVIASLYPAAKASRTAAAELRREDV